MSTPRKEHLEESVRNLSIQMQFDQLRRELVSELKGDLKNAGKATTEDDEPDEPPFVQAIIDAPVRQKSRLLTFDKYDGTKDTIDHVETYESITDFHAYSDAMKCKAFTITL